MQNYSKACVVIILVFASLSSIGLLFSAGQIFDSEYPKSIVFPAYARNWITWHVPLFYA